MQSTQAMIISLSLYYNFVELNMQPLLQLEFMKNQLTSVLLSLPQWGTATVLAETAFLRPTLPRFLTFDQPCHAQLAIVHSHF